MSASFFKNNNFIFGNDLYKFLKKGLLNINGAHFFAYSVQNPQNYAVLNNKKNTIIDIEENYTSNNSDESNSIKLDRMINLARDRGSTVYTSSKFSNNICIIVLSLIHI